MADLVADSLRDRVLSGQLHDGDLLPRQDQLVDEFGVSPPSMREAFRILETEGLVTIIRGTVGGARVELPRPEKVAYLLAMVLQTRGVSIDDVAVSLGELEALCAGMAARRADRAAAVASLRDQIDHSRRSFDDTDAYVRSARRFHELLVQACGSDTLIIVLGAIEVLWSAHVEELTLAASSAAPFAESSYREQSLAVHEAIVDAIEAGDPALAEQLARDHMAEPSQHRFVGRQSSVRSALVRHAEPDAGHRPVD